MTTPTPAPTPEPSDAQLEAQLTSYDPVRDVPSSFKVKGEPRILQPTIEAFAPDVQQRIRERLAGVTPGNRDLFEREFIREELQNASKAFRLMGGVGDEATETQRTDADIANQIRLLQKDEQRLQTMLEEDRTIPDPITGQQVPSGDKRVQGSQRRAYEGQLFDVRRQMNLLQGPEGEKLRRAALEADKARIREQRRSAAELQQARQLAEQRASTERVEKLADAFHRNSRSNIG